MGQWGQCHHIPGMTGHCLVTLGGGHTHTVFDRWFELRSVVRVSYGGVYVILSS